MDETETPLAHITFDEAKALLEELVNKKGEDFIYTKPKNVRKCCYFNPNNGQPSCGIGYVLWKKGITYQQLKKLERNFDTFTSLVAHQVISTDPRARLLLHYFQYEQDNEKPYKPVLDYALIRTANRSSQ